jgi:hypothetical protein
VSDDGRRADRHRPASTCSRCGARSRRSSVRMKT